MPSATIAQRKLQKASYKGVPFEVTGASYNAGRRVAVFEFPQKDTPFVEDLGRKATEYSFTAFVVGIDYIQKMNALVNALESKGSGKLVHPWLGEKTVIAKEANNVKYSSKLLTATIDLTFVEAPPQESTVAKDLISNLGFKTNALLDSVVSGFIDKFDLSGVQDYVHAAVSGNLGEMLGLPDIKNVAKIFEKSDELADLVSNTLAVVQGGSANMATVLLNTLGLGSFATTVSNWRGIARQLSRLTKSPELNTKSSVESVKGTSRQQIEDSTDTMATFIRQVELSNVIGAAANIGTDYDAVNDSLQTSVMSYDELISVRDEILDAIDDEMLKTDNDEIYVALEDARTAVWECLTERANDNARLVTVTPNEVMPALVLAYDYYGDANRDAEIIGRNNVSNPNFLPTTGLRILSE